jgi:hypothetical protein
MTAPPLPDSGPGPWDDTVPWPEVWSPDWKEDTWLSSKGVMVAGLADAAVLISRVQLVHIHKNDFHFLSLIISLPYCRHSFFVNKTRDIISYFQVTKNIYF